MHFFLIKCKYKMKLNPTTRHLPLVFWPTVILCSLGLSACGMVGKKSSDPGSALKPPAFFLASDWMKSNEKNKVIGQSDFPDLQAQTQTEDAKTPTPAMAPAPAPALAIALAAATTASSAGADPQNNAALNAPKAVYAALSPLQPEPTEPGSDRVQANQCWAQMIVKPLRDQSVRQITVQESRNGFETSPPELSKTKQKFVVKDGYEAFKVSQPKFKQVTERILVKEETKTLVVEPAVFTEQIEKVMTESERVEMQACKNAGVRIAGKPQNSQSFCAVRIPAVYKSVTKRVLTQEETVVEKTTPAVYKNIVKTVLVENGHADPVQVAPLTASIPVTVVAREAEAIMVRVEPKVVPVPLTTYTTAPQLTWRRVVCEKEASPSLIRNLQAALLKEGFDAGPTDAKLGKKTMAAVESYQTQMGVASGILTYETLKLLGLEPLAGLQP